MTCLEHMICIAELGQMQYVFRIHMICLGHICLAKLGNMICMAKYGEYDLYGQVGAHELYGAYDLYDLFWTYYLYGQCGVNSISF